jgi:hypothetical protein
VLLRHRLAEPIKVLIFVGNYKMVWWIASVDVLGSGDEEAEIQFPPYLKTNNTNY